MDFKPSDLPSMDQKLHFFSNPIKKSVSQLMLFFSLIISSIVCYNIIRPLQPRSLIDIGYLSQILSKTSKTCDYSYGKWVWDETQSLRRYTEKCPLLDPGFRCRQNGRKDLDYQKWRWQPEGCHLPRFDAKDFLRRSQNGRIVFAGDSIGRNQWESLICMLTQGVSNQSTVYEENGNPITKHKGFLSIRFQEYNLTVEYYRMPYLVVIDRPPENSSKEVTGVVRVDKLHWFSTKWVGANVFVFSAGHWWNQDKTVKRGHFFQEGKSMNMTMDVMEAFRRSLNTLKSWLMQNLEPKKSLIFFRSYSPVHYRDGEWNEGGHCNLNVEPETDYKRLNPEPRNNVLMHEVVKQMESAKRNVHFLNITYLTEFRKDGHPSSHREPGTSNTAPQDCSHWCLPGVPDTWNELLYAKLLATGFKT
ncbi:protein trichome birefringence-like 9 [Olea europaea var. sylvestris]|uniref:Trichome birefringence-like N-terminal domain-containing protein n=1 Tax=Olea europaea subsp. europaea TaxID=158383 RepID=A0A8S0QG54_OLEEU|nr:protein trichome birefringence-like 9 [Olea europaea var. sylvestris]CAA2966555.1 Hypothetical predicted protein [Olea europaea subsp. europaea]